MLDIESLLILIPALPLAAAAITALLGKRILRDAAHLPTVVAVAISFVASVLLIFEIRQADLAMLEDNTQRQIGFEQVYTLWTWAADNRESPGDAPRFQIDVALRADPLTAIMLATVTGISLLVAVYSIGYMRGDPGYWRFFTYISLFVFSMTALVSASNFVMLYAFWEAVGLCSYLLIGFWFEKPAAAAAGMKAFLVNRVGDFGFAIGLFLLWTTYGTLNFHDTGDGAMGILGQSRLHNPSLYIEGTRATAICLLLLLGACGKSAQFPLHVWLPDAMEGPTPVSALIHAATMVTAGVYMIARCAPLFAASPDAQQVVAIIGGLTVLLSAVIAIAQTDLKRILAYSTISQLGYMFLGLGAGSIIGVTAAMFHLFTHAFFKALLFLGAGSVMHAMGGVIDIDRIGGLRRRLPITHWTFLIGCLALCGIFPFAGFWSKDMILASLRERREFYELQHLYSILFLVGLAGVFLTAFYTFRAYFRTFLGLERLPLEVGLHAHESPKSMTVPLVILAACSLVVGAYFELTHGFAEFLARTPSAAYMDKRVHSGIAFAEYWVAKSSTIIALLGILLAAALYLGNPRKAEIAKRFMSALGLYQLARGKFLLDWIYDLLIVFPLKALAYLCSLFDGLLIDGLVDLAGAAPIRIGDLLRRFQNGLVQYYALIMVLGLLVLIAALLM
jgi:NADH-quinone oxidoreductase subunit L